MAGYYDIVLGLIPVALLGITAALTVVGISPMSAVPIGAFVALGCIGHAMFVNAPVETPEETPTSSPQATTPINAE